MMQEEQVGGNDGGQADHRLRQSSARRRAARGGGAPSVHHDDEAGSSRQHPTDTHAGGTTEASIGGTPFTHVSSSQVLHGCSTQLLADLAATSFTMNLDDQLGGPQFYADFDEFIQGDDVHQYQSPIPGGPSDPTEYRPHPANMPEIQVPETQLPVDLNEPAGSPYDTWFGMGGTPPSAFGVGAQEAPPGDRRAARVRRPTRCGTGSHLLGPFGGDHDVDGDQQ
ncbi:uncharacterized protein DS421_10g292360 [Arachis hypogaea]|nr:uncharacterized protein DS421_10g292360 [Arachis hypogaea]